MNSSLVMLPTSINKSRFYSAEGVVTKVLFWNINGCNNDIYKNIYPSGTRPVHILVHVHFINLIARFLHPHPTICSISSYSYELAKVLAELLSSNIAHNKYAKDTLLA